MRLIQIPYDLGREGWRMGAGPGRLVEDGADALGEAGHEVEVTRIEAPEEVAHETGASFAVIRRGAESVARAVREGAFPVVLAGNCMSSVGTVAGLGRDVGVVWLDAHADFNTPDSTPSGFLDGMGLSILTGTGWRALREEVPGYRSVPEACVVLVGIRDVDPAEEERLAGSDVHVVRPEDVRGRIAAALDALREQVDGVYLHVDLDVLDPSEGKANSYAGPGGLAATTVADVVAVVGERLAVRAAALTAYDPAADEQGKLPRVGADLLVRIAAAARAHVEAAS